MSADMEAVEIVKRLRLLLADAVYRIELFDCQGRHEQDPHGLHNAGRFRACCEAYAQVSREAFRVMRMRPKRRSAWAADVLNESGGAPAVGAMLSEWTRKERI